MATVLAKPILAKDILTVSEHDSGDDKKQAADSVFVVTTIPPLGAPGYEKRFWWQRDKSFDPHAIATQVSSCQLLFYFSGF